MTAFTISIPTWRDIKDLHRLEALCFEDDAWPMLDLLAVLTFPSAVRFKAEIAGKMVGFIAGDRHNRENVGWVTTIGVLPDYRNQGIATALMKICETNLEMPKIRLCVRRSNLEAQRLYIHLGYHQIDVWKRYYTRQEDALVYEKTLVKTP